jgi:hypothetical protein
MKSIWNHFADRMIQSTRRKPNCPILFLSVTKDLSRPTSLSEAEREEQKKNHDFKLLAL